MAWQIARPYKLSASERLFRTGHARDGGRVTPAFWLMFGAAPGIIAALTVYRGGRTMEVREAVTA